MEDILKIIAGFGSLFLTIVIAIGHWKKSGSQEVKEDSKEKAELDMKIKELEGRIDTQYGELKMSILALEKTITDTKSANYAFETRLIESVDKLDRRMERIHDLVIGTLIKNQ